MTAWLLVALVVSGGGIATKPFGVFMDEDDCEKARDLLMAQGPMPKINYEVLCVKVNGQPIS